MYKEVTGDLIKMAHEFDIIAHGCNCYCVMGSGIARTIADTFNVAVAADNKTEKGNYNKLGTISGGKCKNTYILNLYTQHEPGPNASLLALEMCLDKLRFLAKKNNLNKIGLPLIGCGIGGLNWSDVEPLIKKYLADDFDVTVVRYENN